MKLIFAATAFALAATSALAHDDNATDDQRAALLACVAEHIEVSVRVHTYEHSRIGSSFVMAEVTNNLDYAIAGIGVEYTIADPNRTVPWETEDAFTAISGGIEPGETVEVTLSMTDVPKERLETAVVTATPIEVADHEKRQLVRAINVIDWDHEHQTPFGCGDIATGGEH